jgi:hypothetical protein
VIGVERGEDGYRVLLLMGRWCAAGQGLGYPRREFEEASYRRPDPWTTLHLGLLDSPNMLPPSLSFET